MKYLCPVCEQYKFEEKGQYENCEICGWEDDPIQNDDPTFEGGANVMSLNQARKAWKNGEAVI